MVDTTLEDNVILTQDSVIKLRKANAADWTIFQKILEDPIEFVPEGGEPIKKTALGGNTKEFPSKVELVKSKFNSWLNNDDIELVRGVFGEPTTDDFGSGTEHEFDMHALGQDMEFEVTGIPYGKTGTPNQITVTGTGATISFKGLRLAGKDVWKFDSEISVGNAKLKVNNPSDLS